MSDEWDRAVVDVDRGEQLLTPPQQSRVLAMTQILRDQVNFFQVGEIKRSIAEEDGEGARALMAEFTDDEQRKLWVAPTKGGIFTTHERKVLKNL